MVSKVNKNISKLSIHAPTRGATEDTIMANIYAFFQSTLLQEERQEGEEMNVYEIHFQSTLLQEERHNPIMKNTFDMIFQSTLLQEERPIFLVFVVLKLIFQSTLLQEERQE